MKKKINMYAYESKYHLMGYKNIAGLDEVGRGSWAGPLVVAAVVLPAHYRNDKINDSKQLSHVTREKLFAEITKNAIDYSIVFVPPQKVDELNPKAASIYGMKQAIERLKIKPNFCLVDAETLNTNTKSISIIKGDELSISIAAASIVAKVARDQYMQTLDKKYPHFHFGKHKGYGTKIHLTALKKYGPIKLLHRFSYKPIKMLINHK